MTYHSVAKPVAFFSAVTLAQLHSSSDFETIGAGTLGRAPVSSVLLLLAIVIITGSPPFGIFFSEMMILRAGFAGPHALVAAVLLAALVVLFCGFSYQVGRLVLGPQPAERRSEFTPETLDLCLGTAVVAALIAVIAGFYLPNPLMELIRAATRVVGGRG
jgi:hydrogenase-4 component F